MSEKKLFLIFILALVVPFTIQTSQFLSTKSVRSESSYSLKKRKVNLYKPEYCSINYEDKRVNVQHDPNLTTIYFVTPTFPRPEQIPELTSLSHTLMHVPSLYWIVADDAAECSDSVLNVIKRSGLPYVYILSPKPNYMKTKPFPAGVISRGVANRRAALKWIHRNVHKGVLYFGDDDNTYDLELYSEIRKTRKLSMLPVGLIGSYSVSSPVFDEGKLVGFFDSWHAKRKFPVDMAGFAVNIEHMKRTAHMPFEAGMLEEKFLISAGFDTEEIEPLAENCTKVLVWHTQTYKNKQIRLHADIDYIYKSKYKNLGVLLHELSKMSVVKVDKKRGIDGFIIHNYTQIYDWAISPANRLALKSHRRLKFTYGQIQPRTF